MKIGIIGDVHLGINENKQKFNEYHIKCIKYIHEELKKQNIKDIIYLGDIFDKRFSISVKTLKESQELFKLDSYFNRYFILGNHDSTYKNSNHLSSVNVLLKNNKNKIISEESLEIEFDQKKIILVPWINKSNIDLIQKQIQDSKADYLFGHLDLQGFEMIKGFVSTINSFDRKINKELKKFKHIISGHYHCFAQKNNITYLGNVCQMSWNDVNLKKYFGILDTKTDKLECSEIPFNIYETIKINSNKDLESLNLESFKDKIIKCYLFIKRTIKIQKFISDLTDISQSLTVIDEQIMYCAKESKIEDQRMDLLDLWKIYLEETNLSKKEIVICDKIFKNSYLKIQSGEI